MNDKLTAAKDAIIDLNLDELNELIPFFNTLLKSQRQLKAAKSIVALRPGDQVVVNGLRQRDMNGRQGVVVSIKRTKVVCKFPGTSWDQGANVPATCLTKAA